MFKKNPDPNLEVDISLKNDIRYEWVGLTIYYSSMFE
jgi:hypothetical protein